MNSALGTKQAIDRNLIRAEDIPLGRRVIALLFVVTGYFFYAWSWNTVDVLRPYISQALHLNLTQAGSLYSAQALGALIGAVINGQVADRIGRRNALAIVMVAFGSALLAGIVVQTYAEVLVQRFLLGYFAGSMFPIAVGLYAGLFSSAIRVRIAGFVFAVYNAAVSLLGAVSAFVFAQHRDWKLLLLAGAAPVVLAGLAFILVPDDRAMTAFGVEGDTPTARKLPVRELFAVGVRRQTLLLVLMMGLNFFAYQAFTGWATTYLRGPRGLSDSAIGAAIGWQFAGACLGGFLWGWVGDRFGRRAAAWGFVAAAAFIGVYLYAPLSPSALQLAGFGYGVMLSASVVWGPWLAELYPPHLRSTAASMYNWGRIVSFMAPLITAAIAEHFGLQAAMGTAAISFLLSAAIWRSLPETVVRAAQVPAGC